MADHEYEYVLQLKHDEPSLHQTPAERDLPIGRHGKIVGVCLVNEDGVGVFVEDGNTQREEPDDAVATFRACRLNRPSLMLVTKSSAVTVTSPPSPDLPSSLRSIDLPASEENSSESTRYIYLRPGDTVYFSEPPCHVSISARRVGESTPPRADGGTASADVQVKSSAAAEQSTSDAPVVGGAENDSETEDEDEDETGLLKTPGTAEHAAAGIYHYPDLAAGTVQDTPSRPGKGDNGVFSTAPDMQHSQSDHEAPALRAQASAARNSTGPNAEQEPATNRADVDNDSQNVFRDPKKTKHKTYAHTPRGSRPGTPALKTTDDSANATQKPGTKPACPAHADVGDAGSDIRADVDTPVHNDDASGVSATPLSPEAAADADEGSDLDTHIAKDEGSRKRKRTPADDASNTAAQSDPAEEVAAPITKKSKGRPRKSDPKQSVEDDDINQAQTGGTDENATKKRRGRPRKSDASAKHETVDADADPPTGTWSGKLKRPNRPSGGKGRKSEEIEDNDEEADAAEQTPNVGAGTREMMTPQLSASPLASSFETKPPTKILLSSSRYADDKKCANWLKKQGVSIETNIPGRRVNFICVVGNGELHTTAKLLRSLALGKKVVVDQWITDSMKEDRMLLIDGYIHDDLMYTIETDRRKLFVGKTIFFTTALKSSYGEGFAAVEALATECGATRIDSGSATKGGAKSGSGDVIFLGKDDGDPAAQELMTDYERTVYKKDILTQSIIRGELLLDDDDYKLAVVKAKTPAKRGRK